MSGLPESLKKRVQKNFDRKLFDQKLENYLRRDQDIGEIVETVEKYDKRIITDAGKRLRAFLPIIMAKGLEIDYTDEELHEVFVPVEAIHGTSLILDDVMDRDELRRGMKTSHMRMRDENISGCQADSITILDAFQLQSISETSPAKMEFLSDSEQIELIQLISSAVKKICRGQMLDIAGESLSFQNNGLQTRDKEFDFEEFYSQMVKLKTAPLFNLGPEIIELLADEKKENLRHYTQHLAMAYQIRDDLIDLERSETNEEPRSGKDRFSDLEDGKITYPIFHALKSLEKKDKEGNKGKLPEKDDLNPEGKFLLNILQDHDPGFKDLKRAVKIIQETGSFEKSNRKIKAHTQKATKAISRSDLKREQKELLKQIAEFSVRRTR